MTQPAPIRILPYSQIVGQEQLKLALELAFIAPRLGGVLISGQRGTGKSTAVRAFARMMYGRLPVTLPINATEDRVVGGFDINQLMLGEVKRRQGLLEDAHESLLYIDEVNLLDDHIVNIILDVTSTGVLVIQREAQDIEEKHLAFTLVGTMNPEEGGLRPQLLDRFGLMVSIVAEDDPARRLKILHTVMTFDQLWRTGSPPKTQVGAEAKAEAENQKIKDKLIQAQGNLDTVKVSRTVAEKCVALTQAFKAEGNRGDYILMIAACAYAALQGGKAVTVKHVQDVARMVLQHRRPEILHSSQISWGTEDDEKVKDVLES